MVKDSLNTTPICPKCLVRMEPSKATKGLYYCWDCELLLDDTFPDEEPIVIPLRGD